MEEVKDVVFRHVVSDAAKPLYFLQSTNTESYCHADGQSCVGVGLLQRMNSLLQPQYGGISLNAFGTMV
jgi:hypothetical protein